MNNYREKIKSKINFNSEWSYPYWIDEIKEQYPDVPEEEIENFYFGEIKKKIESMDINELRKLLKDQNNHSSANQNFFVVQLIESKLSGN